MKFSTNFESGKVPEWSDFYINYNRLNSHLHLARQAPSPEEGDQISHSLYHGLEISTQACLAFRCRQQALLERENARSEKWLGLTVDSAQKVDLQTRNKQQLRYILRRLVGFRSVLRKVASFDHFNQLAIERLVHKASKFAPEAHLKTLLGLQEAWSTRFLPVATQCHRLLDTTGRLVNSILDQIAAAENLDIVSRPDYPQKWTQHLPAQPEILMHTWQSLLKDDIWSLANGPRNVPAPTFTKNFKLDLLHAAITNQASDCTFCMMGDTLEVCDLPEAFGIFRHLLSFTEKCGTGELDSSDVTAPVVSSNNVHWTERCFREFIIWLGPELHLRQSKVGELLLVPRLDKFLQSKNTNGRYPLHYAVYGSCFRPIVHSLEESSVTITGIRDAILFVDEDGHTALDHAVIAKQSENVEFILEIFKHRSDAMHGGQAQTNALGNALAIALRYQHDEIVSSIAQSALKISYISKSKSTLLHITAQTGRADHLRLLLSLTIDAQDVNAEDPVSGWTALFIAGIRGHLGLVEELLRSGADASILDNKGWTAGEQAVLRGHMEIGARLASPEVLNKSAGPADPMFGRLSQPAAATLGDDEKLLIITLGITQKSRPTLPFYFDIPENRIAAIQAGDVGYTIGISCDGAREPERLVSSPFLADIINEPLLFHTSEDTAVRLCFRVYPNTDGPGTQRKPIAGGAIMLEVDKHRFGVNRESLLGDHTVSLQDTATMSAIGHATFSTLVVRPFPKRIPDQPAPEIALEVATGVAPIVAGPHADQIAPEVAGPCAVEIVGHRGLGQNTVEKTYLQLGENTIESFISASKLGASIVEFDVQITRDLVPVIYHDYSLSETGTDVPIHDLTLDQFLHASDIQYPQDAATPLLVSSEKPARAERRPLKRNSVSSPKEHEREAAEIRNRLRYTLDYKNKGFKPNTRGNYVQDSFTTFRELFTRLPKEIGFNAEIKYPRIQEAVATGLAPIALEINTFVDAALETIARYANGRKIILSSFTPEVCIALSLKQRTYPVMFITNAGKVPMVDMEKRAQSLQVAVAFAQRWGLAGLVFACDVFLLCPRLIRYVKNRGLKCASYGPPNNVPELAVKQVEAGLDILIADRVGVVAKALGKA